MPTSSDSWLRDTRRSALLASPPADAAKGIAEALAPAGRPGRGHEGSEICPSRFACDDTCENEGLGTTALAFSVDPRPDRRRLMGCSLSTVPDLRAGRMSEPSTSARNSADNCGTCSSSVARACAVLDEARSAMVRDFGRALSGLSERDDLSSHIGLITCEGER